MKSLDKYNVFSIIILLVSVVVCCFLSIRSINSKPLEDHLIIIVNSISSVFSISGLIIAILQILKVSRNSRVYKEAYDQAINAVINNETVSLLTRSLTHISVIKQLFQSQLEKHSASYFDNLVLDLTFLSSNKNIDIGEGEKLNIYICYCKDMNTMLYKSNIAAIPPVDYSDKYETLTEIQSFLSSMQQKLTTPKEN